MPMQPLTRYPNAAVTLMQDNTMASRPDIAVVVAECIGVWAEIEFILGYTLSMILGADYKAGLAMYLALKGASPRQDAINAAASAMMAQEQKDVFDAVMIIVKKAYVQRNRLAHWCWGSSPQIPDGLLLIDPAYKVRHMAGMDDGNWGFDKSHAFVVKKRDVDEILVQLIEARNLAGRISGFLWRRTPAERRAGYLLQLRNEPRVQEALRQVQKGRKTSR